MTASTLSGRSASAARKATSAESIPPDRPTITRENPTRVTSVRIKSTIIFRARSALICRGARTGFIISALAHRKWSSFVQFLFCHPAQLVADQLALFVTQGGKFQPRPPERVAVDLGNHESLFKL